MIIQPSGSRRFIDLPHGLRASQRPKMAVSRHDGGSSVLSRWAYSASIMAFKSLRVSDFSNPLRIRSSISVSRNSIIRQRRPSRRRWRCRRMRSAAAVRVAESAHDKGGNVISIQILRFWLFIYRNRASEKLRREQSHLHRASAAFLINRYLRLSARNCGLLERHAPRPGGRMPQLRWTRQVSPTARNREQRASATWRLSASTRMRVHAGAAVILTVGVRITIG
jgi:hypothetical protein